MKTNIHCLVSVATALVAVQPSLHAADPASAPKEEKREVRVLSFPGREHRVVTSGAEKRKVEMETVTFLGVETASVSATTASQLGLPRGTGLVVNHLVPESPAMGVLAVHDILLKLDDQILIETRQLAVLIRNHLEGEEVTLTYLRGGQKSTAKIKLGRQEVPKMATLEHPSSGIDGLPFGLSPEIRAEIMAHGPDGLERREEWDRVLSLLQRARPAPDGPPGLVPSSARIRIDHSGGTGLRAMSITAGNGNLVFSDDEGSLELTIKDGVKSLVANGPKGEAVFAGPVTTSEERAAMPPLVRARLEKLEGMHDLSFRTDGDFKGAETRIIRPRGILLPVPPRPPVPPRLPAVL